MQCINDIGRILHRACTGGADKMMGTLTVILARKPHIMQAIYVDKYLLGGGYPGEIRHSQEFGLPGGIQ